MKLGTIFKKKQEIHTSKKSGVTDIDLLFKFFGLAGRLNLQVEQDKDGVLYAGDGTGEMSFKRFTTTAWFKFEPYDYKSDARRIFIAQ